MKFLIIGDLHIPNKFIGQVTDEIISIAKTNNIKDLIILGDILNNRDSLSSSAMDQIIDFRDKLNDNNIKTVIVAGNHDIRDGNKSFVSLFTNGNFKFVSEYDPFSDVVYIPYYTTKEDILTLVPFDKLVCGHISEQHDTLVDKALCKKLFPMTLSGHIHDFEDHRNFVYLGNTTTTNFGESNDKFYAIYETATKKIDYHKFINNNKFVTVKYGSDLYEQYKYNDSNNFYIRVIVESADIIPDIKKELKNLKNSPRFLLEKKVSDVADITIKSQISFDNILDDFIKFKNLDDDMKNKIRGYFQKA
jgi:DNA repair exonuclease SbcCD nuclease subunit